MLLQVSNLDVAYQEKQVVFNTSLTVDSGEFVSLIGHNGAGKTTLLKAICGYLHTDSGQVLYKAEQINNISPAVNVRKGISFVHQEKSLFPNLTVIENLELAAHAIGKTENLKERLQEVYRLFPILEERRKQKAQTLSGGQQKQLAIGMAILVRPDLLLLDEPSLGLSPNLVNELGKVLQEIQQMGMSVLLVEQNVKMAISLSHRIYVMRTGQIILEETGEEMMKRESLWDLF